MGQVPQYLIVGDGRLARHLCHYFSLFKIQRYNQWYRSQPIERFHDLKAESTHILLPIKDSAIEPFIDEHLSDFKGTKVHFSGGLVSKKAWGAHPLMTFGPDLYPLEKYLSIPFVVDDKAPDFKKLLPGLHNPSVRLNAKQKAKYHALCVMAGNFSCLLWQNLFGAFEAELGIPPHTADMFLRQQGENFLPRAHGASRARRQGNDRAQPQGAPGRPVPRHLCRLRGSLAGNQARKRRARQTPPRPFSRRAA
jgi:hypothetical protein